MVDPLSVHQMAGSLLQHVDALPGTIEAKIAALRAAAETLSQAQSANTSLLILANVLKR